MNKAYASLLMANTFYIQLTLTLLFWLDTHTTYPCLSGLTGVSPGQWSSTTDKYNYIITTVTAPEQNSRLAKYQIS